jgi:hypothetical protein
MKNPVSKRVPVLVEKDTYTLLQQYSQKTGVTATHAINEALHDWLEVVGAARLEAFAKPGADILRDNLLVMPSKC